MAQESASAFGVSERIYVPTLIIIVLAIWYFRAPIKARLGIS